MFCEIYFFDRYKHLRRYLLALCGLFLFAPSLLKAEETDFGVFDCPAVSKPEPLETQLLAKVSGAYAKLEHFKAKFLQESYFMGSDERRHSQGQIFFLKRGLMDWRYEFPDRQRFLTDGEFSWWYQPEQNQVLLGDLSAAFSTDVPLSFLLGVGDLEKNFILQGTCSKKLSAKSSAAKSVLVLSLKPRTQSDSLSMFYLLVDAERFNPLGARAVDVGDNSTSIILSELDLQSPLQKQSFKFEIPKGTDVIDKRSVK